MAIQRWDPVRDLQRLQQSLNRLFDDALVRSGAPEGPGSPGPGEWRPPIDLVEEEGRFVLRADLPGVTPPDVQLRVESGSLLLRGERRADADARGASLRTERPSGRFATQVRLPASVDPSGIKAHHRDGVLEIELPKRRADDRGRIEVVSD